MQATGDWGGGGWVVVHERCLGCLRAASAEGTAAANGGSTSMRRSSVACRRRSPEPDPLSTLEPTLKSRRQHPAANLLMGGAAGTLAATACYPLDTIRRRMQMRGVMYQGQVGGRPCCRLAGKDTGWVARWQGVDLGGCWLHLSLPAAPLLPPACSWTRLPPSGAARACAASTEAMPPTA